VPQFQRLPVGSALLAGLRVAGVLGLGFAVAGLGSILPLQRAEAQGVFGYWDSSPPKPRKKVRRAPPADEEVLAAKSGKKSKTGDVAERPVVGPLVINVSLSRQRLTVYDSNGPIAESPISSGRVGYGTPTGVFSVLEKRRMHYSNLYAGAPMPNMQRITWSGVALHAGVLPGYPASHGCIRLPHGFSKKLFGMTTKGTRVIVTRDPVTPVAFSHDRLFAAFPPETDAADAGSSQQPTQVADASAATGRSGDSVSAVLGVSTAAAATVEDDAPAVAARLSFRERRRLEAERLSAEIRTAGYEKATLASALEHAHNAAEAARAPLVSAKAEAQRLADSLAKLEKAKERGEREIADLTKPAEDVTEPKSKSKKRKAERKRKPKKMDAAKRQARIAELTEELAELPAEIETTRAAWTAADRAFKDAEATAKSADDKRRAAASDLMKVNAVLQQALAKEVANKRLEERRHLPVSVFISRAKQRLYIRQGYDDILDVAVTFDRPEEPVGTHVFTALEFADSKTAMTWSAVSVPYDPTRSAAKKKKKKADKKSKKPEPEVAKVEFKSQTPSAALERITIPEDVREQIADVMKPGSSLVISDHGLSNETGKYTDLIATIR
jgi:hypothetical protein